MTSAYQNKNKYKIKTNQAISVNLWPPPFKILQNDHAKTKQETKIIPSSHACINK